MQLIRIVIADDHGLFREGVINLLKDSSELYVVGEASNGRELVSKYFEIKPDVVISDILMPDLSGIEAAKRIIEKDESAKILFLSMYDSEEYVYQILKVGGLGLLNKSVEKPELIEAIKEVTGDSSISGKIALKKS
jgi:DNA-binding NarL/FixJ family response regulator